MKNKIQKTFFLILLTTISLNVKAQNSSIQDEIKNYTNLGFNLFLKKECDLNLDKHTDFIVVFKPSKTKIKKGEDLIYVCVFIDNIKNFKTFESGGIVYPNTNTLAEGLQEIAIKNNYFTFEQQITSGRDFFEYEYTTFKYDLKKKKIFLHRYSLSKVFTNSKKDVSKNFTFKNFGVIEFNSFEMNELKEILN